MIALNKKDGGLRPICIGEVIRRTIGMAVILQAPLPNLEFQFGAGDLVRIGLELMVQQVKHAIQNPESDEDLVVLKVDFANAFNNISRDAFLHIVDHQLPQISSYMESCYMSSSVLYLMTHNWSLKKEFSKVILGVLFSFVLCFSH